MAYHLYRDDSLPAGIMRVAHKQIDGTIKQLGNQQLSQEYRIHQARKRFKKLRGLLRLVRPALGEKVYRRENVCFRDAGRAFAVVRDAEAVIQTCDTFQTDLVQYLGDRGFHTLRAALVQRQQYIMEEQSDLDATIAQVRDDLYIARERVATWPLDNTDFEALAKGFQKTYQRGRKAYEQAYAEPTVEHFHTWRKRVKYHLYHTRLLEYIWAEVMAGRRHTIKYLSGLLGDDHDLAVLYQTVQQQPALLGSEGNCDVLHEAIDQRQTQLRAIAWSMGARVFAEKPKYLTRRMHRYWDAWQSQDQPVAV
jgi:CHAD domain-containing protein